VTEHWFAVIYFPEKEIRFDESIIRFFILYRDRTGSTGGSRHRNARHFSRFLCNNLRIGAKQQPALVEDDQVMGLVGSRASATRNAPISKVPASRTAPAE
jgi:hypothetical protein